MLARALLMVAQPPGSSPRLVVYDRRARSDHKPSSSRLPGQVAGAKEDVLAVLVSAQPALLVQVQELRPAVARHCRGLVRVQHGLVVDVEDAGKVGKGGRSDSHARIVEAFRAARTTPRRIRNKGRGYLNRFSSQLAH